MSMPHSPRHPQRQALARKKNLMARFTWIALFAIVVAVVVITSVAFLSSRHEVTCTVESKERTTHVQDGKSTQQKLIYTDQCGTLTVDDAWYTGQFNSADTYGSLKEGKTYEFTTIGWRNGFLSMFPNIISVTPTN